LQNVVRKFHKIGLNSAILDNLVHTMPRVLHCSASCCLVSAGHGILNRLRGNRHEQHISQSRMFNKCLWSCRCHTLCNTCSHGYQLSSSTVVVLSESYIYIFLNWNYMLTAVRHVRAAIPNTHLISKHTPNIKQTFDKYRCKPGLEP
jgi:hypothetical protein